MQGRTFGVGATILVVILGIVWGYWPRAVVVEMATVERAPMRVTVDEEGRLRVRVENPFSEELLAGRILGIYRALWADPARVEWTPDTEGYTVIEATRQ